MGGAVLVDRAGLRDRYGLIVIGAGPAGLTLARRFEQRASRQMDADAGHRQGAASDRVLLIESGAASASPGEAQALSEVEAAGAFPADYYWRHSRRGLGGTSQVWSGLCAVMERRAFDGGEWPIRYEELAAYYPDAARWLRLPSAVHEQPETALGNGGSVVYRPYYFAKTPLRFAFSHGEWLRRSRNVDALFDHTATGVDVRGGEAVAVSVRESRAAASAPMRLRADRIVLAGGGVQNARLLLLSLPQRGHRKLPAGACFSQHPHLYDFAWATLDRAALEDAGWTAERDGVVPGVALSSAYANEHGLASVTLGWDASAPVAAKLLGRSAQAVRATLTARAEMPALPENRITLAAGRRFLGRRWFSSDDFLGQPRARVAFDMNLGAVRVAANRLNAELVRSGVGRLRFRPRHRYVTGGGHLMGATRMGEDPATSVTDANGRVHGIRNLYVAGSSLFPAVGSANPTLTIVALALRLADHLTSGPAPAA